MNPYLSRHETAILVDLIQSVLPKVMIEFGCNIGLTARTILECVPSIETYIGVDVPFSHEPELSCQRSEIPYTAGLMVAKDPRFWLLVREGGSLALTPSDLELCDAVFIDGDHSERVVSHDSYLARALTRPGGIIVWHDNGNPAVEVTQALDRLRNEGWPIQSVDGTWLAYVRISDHAYEATQG